RDDSKAHHPRFPAPGRRWKRFRPDVLERFATLYQGDPMQTALLFLSQQPATLRRAAVTLTPAQIDQAADSLILLDDWVFHIDLWSRLLDQTIRLLTAFHAAEPLRAGMPPESLRSQLRLDSEAFELFLQELARQQHLVLENGIVRLPHHTIRLSTAQEEMLRRLKRDFEQSPYTPPTVSQAREIVGDALLNHLLERGELVRISTEVLLTPSVWREWIDFSRHQLDQGVPLTVASLRDHFQTTRRYALDFLERLDALGITKRKGDERVRGSADWSKMGYS
ncbi:MAG TPA: SelB C-terminal domain-containing protein, partial [Aggregatilineaceae bacterium]|nr:SelB C-terminal domain-containing protein [Aggregatilineaceae bacterium]